MVVWVPRVPHRLDHAHVRTEEPLSSFVRPFLSERV